MSVRTTYAIELRRDDESRWGRATEFPGPEEDVIAIARANLSPGVQSRVVEVTRRVTWHSSDDPTGDERVVLGGHIGRGLLSVRREGGRRQVRGTVSLKLPQRVAREMFDRGGPFDCDAVVFSEEGKRLDRASFEVVVASLSTDHFNERGPGYVELEVESTGAVPVGAP